MKNSYVKTRLLVKEELASHIYRLVLSWQFPPKPGQFFMVRGWQGSDPFLARAISVADYEDGLLSFIIDARGLGTQLITSLEPGRDLEILGPLGQGFSLPSSKKVGLVGGGVGSAPLLYLAKKLNIKPDLYLGFRDQAYLIEDFRPYVGEIKIASDSGEAGYKGQVTDLIKPDDYELIMACGPMGMIKSLSSLASASVELELSLENNMACGIGVCLGCTVETQDGMETVCKDGPVFKESRLIL